MKAIRVYTNAFLATVLISSFSSVELLSIKGKLLFNPDQSLPEGMPTTGAISSQGELDDFIRVTYST